MEAEAQGGGPQLVESAQRAMSDLAAADGIALEGDAQPVVESEQPAEADSPRDAERRWRRLGPDGPSLASPVTGFAELGERAPSADDRGAQGPGGEQASAQLLSFRTFWPGQSYTPDVRSKPCTFNCFSPMCGFNSMP